MTQMMRFWADTRQRINKGALYPFIGESLSYEMVFGKDYEAIIQKWAVANKYPWNGRCDATSVSQFLLMQNEPSSVRFEFLNYLNTELMEYAKKAQQEGLISADNLKKTRQKFDEGRSGSFTELADSLGYLDFKKMPNHPYSILATMPLKVYVTTCYDQFLEKALTDHAKPPRSEIYPWNQGIEKNIRTRKTSIFQQDPGYEPTAEQPLVIHLLGRDDDHRTLVLTENDYMDFLIKLTRDLQSTSGAAGDPVVNKLIEQIRNTQGYDSSPLILGYNLRNWDFRVLFRGIFVPVNEDRSIGVFLQMKDEYGDHAMIENLLPPFMNAYKLQIFFGTAQECLLQLMAKWKGTSVKPEQNENQEAVRP